MNSSSPNVNIIAEGTKLKGDLSSKTDIRIAGEIEGEARSNGKLIITAKGLVNGNIKSVEADIAGRIEGEIQVSDRLTLRSSAVINGDIATKTLIVEEGAQINGSCRMGAKMNSANTEPVEELKVKNAS